MSRTLFSTEAILAPPTRLAFNCEMVGRDIKGMSLKGFSRRLPDQLLVYKIRLKKCMTHVQGVPTSTCSLFQAANIKSKACSLRTFSERLKG